MKIKKLLLPLIALGIISCLSLAKTSNANAFSNYYFEDGVDNPESSSYISDEKVTRIDITCDSNPTEYKVTQDYDASKYAWFRFDDNCSEVIFDLNGKTVERGAVVVLNNTTIRLRGTGGGIFKNVQDHAIINGFNHLISNLVNVQGYVNNGIKIIFESGTYEGNVEGNSVYGETVEINGRDAAFVNSRISGAEIANGQFGYSTIAESKITDGEFTDITIENTSHNAGHNIGGGVFHGNLAVAADSYLQISGGTFYDVTFSGEGTIEIFGGTFTTRPDEKYLASGYQISQTSDGKYIVEHTIAINNVLNYLAVGQSNNFVMACPYEAAQSLEMTSSDETIVSLSYTDIDKNAQQMYAGCRNYTFTAKKAGKATIHYKNSQIEGSFEVYVTKVDASAYGNVSGEAIRQLTSFASCAWSSDHPGAVAEKVYCYGPSAWGPISDETKTNHKKLTAAFEAGHEIKVTLDEKIVDLTDNERELVLNTESNNYNLDGTVSEVVSTKGFNIASAYELTGQVIDMTTKEVIIDDWTSAISSLPLPEFLKNRSRQVEIVTINYYEGGVNARAYKAEVEDGCVVFNGGLLWGDKYVVLYDGSPINPDGTTDDVPATPNSGFEEDLSDETKSIALVLGASAAVLLVVIALSAYAIYRKKSFSKVHF